MLRAHDARRSGVHAALPRRARALRCSHVIAEAFARFVHALQRHGSPWRAWMFDSLNASGVGAAGQDVHRV
jgi:hypothetical protein